MDKIEKVCTYCHKQITKRENKFCDKICFDNFQRCHKKPINYSDSLAGRYPQIACEWHPTKNGDLTPSDVMPRTNRKVWWLCPKGHGYEAECVNRTRCKFGCMYCVNFKVCPDNCLAFKQPIMAAQWHPTKNGKMTPNNVVAGSTVKVWWKCSVNSNHEWERGIRDHVRKGGGCPICHRLNKRSRGELKIASILTKKGMLYEHEGKFDSCRNVRMLPFDFVINYKNKCVGTIEFQGPHHYQPVGFYGGDDEKKIRKFKQTIANDEIKRSWCRNNCIPHLEIPHWEKNLDLVIDEFLYTLHDLTVNYQMTYRMLLGSADSDPFQ